MTVKNNNTSKELILDQSINGHNTICLMALKTILESYQDDIDLSGIIGLGGDGVVLRKTVEIDDKTQEFAVKYSR